MLFNSFAFLVFFPCVTALWFAAPVRWRWAVLLGASSVFYMAFIPAYILILVWTILVDYCAGILIENATGRRRRVFLGVSILSNFGVLFFFKYFNFAAENLNALAAAFGAGVSIQAWEIILPVGLSFHTFQAVSYTVEVYRGRQPAERHLGIFALYIMFYPQLVAGPIERPQNLLPQFHSEQQFEEGRVVDGLRLMLWGAIKKVVIADRVAVCVNAVFDHPQDHFGLSFLAASLFFAVQIYCDFSGYSDIALGAAQVMGFRLMENFKRPYLASSLSEFWQRWHISLSTWFRDYLYVPLGGSRVGLGRLCLNLLIVFAVSGLWHGARWTFVVWGLLHGFYMVVGRLTAGVRGRISSALGLARFPVAVRGFNTVVTFTLVCVGWIFFRARDLEGAWTILVGTVEGTALAFGVLAGAFPTSLADLSVLYARTGMVGLFPAGDVGLACGLVALLVAVEVAQEKWGELRTRLAGWPRPLRWVVYEIAVASIFFLGMFQTQQFIYFQF